jgi:hypothetical protein
MQVNIPVKSMCYQIDMSIQQTEYIFSILFLFCVCLEVYEIWCLTEIALSGYQG